MNKAFEALREFHEAGEHAIGEELMVAPELETAWGELTVVHGQLEDENMDPLIKLRAMLMIEELAEVLEAMANGDMVELADGLADLCYVVIGTAVSFGIPLPAVWDEVHRSNMAKFGPGSFKDANGKTQKPPGWTPPDIAGVLADHPFTNGQ